MQLSSPYPSVQPSIPVAFPSPPFVWTALTSQSIGHVDELYIADPLVAHNVDSNG